MHTAQDIVARHLIETRALELALVRALRALLRTAPAGTLRDALERHVDETEAHADRLARRLADLRRAPGVIDTVQGLGERVATELLAAGRAPLELVRGTSREQSRLADAIATCANEMREIAMYDALEQLALHAGDAATARLAADHRADEERMLAELRAALPTVAAAVVGADAPAAPPASPTGADRGRVAAP